MRLALRAGLGALLTLAAVSPAVASAQSPALRVHAIFAGGQAKNFHVGQAIQVDVRNAGGRKITQVCMTPAPIARAACSAATTIAPSAVGPTTVQATLADGTKSTQTFTVLAPATKVGGSRAVPATITCSDVTLFGNYDRRTGHSRDPFEVAKKGTRVGLYNFIGPGKIFMWDYATNKGGFATRSCAQVD